LASPISPAYPSRCRDLTTVLPVRCHARLTRLATSSDLFTGGRTEPRRWRQVSTTVRPWPWSTRKEIGEVRQWAWHPTSN
jgi:hypothetical protein